MHSLTFLSPDSNYTKTEQQIIEFICQNPSSFLTLSISQLARRLEVSDATISRFARHAGYDDFKELKAAAARAFEGTGPAEKLKGSISSHSSLGLDSFLSFQQTCIRKTLELIDRKAFNQAVSTLCQASVIFIHGKGASRSMAQLLAFRLRRFGKTICLVPSGGSELFEELSQAKQGDAVLTFGFQKLPRESRILLKEGKAAGCSTILFTSTLFAETEPSADIQLFVYRGEPEEYHSMAAAAAVVDALILEMASSLGDEAVERLSRLHNMKKRYSQELPG